MSPCTMCGGQGISFCKECDLYKGEYIEKSELKDIKDEIAQACAYAATNYFHWEEAKGLRKAIDIINKHIESEDNNGSNNN